MAVCKQEAPPPLPAADEHVASCWLLSAAHGTPDGQSGRTEEEK
jgi:hypothetical protein